MKFRHLILALFSLISLVICSCGSNGGAGLNGSIAVTAIQTGAVIGATATYTNPTATNLTGVPITFSAQVGNQSFPLGTVKTNSTGMASFPFTPPAFSGSQTVTVIAQSDNLSNFFSVIMIGRSLTVLAPPTLALTTTAAGGTAFPFIIPQSAAFVTLTDPFFNDISGHLINIQASVVKTNTSDTLSSPAPTTTSSGGTAPFPGASGTLVVPATVGGIETMTVTWTATDTVSGQSGTGVTIITLTKTS